MAKFRQQEPWRHLLSVRLLPWLRGGLYGKGGRRYGRAPSVQHGQKGRGGGGKWLGCLFGAQARGNLVMAATAEEDG